MEGISDVGPIGSVFPELYKLTKANSDGWCFVGMKSIGDRHMRL